MSELYICVSLQGMPYVENLAKKAGEGAGIFLQKKVIINMRTRIVYSIALYTAHELEPATNYPL